MISLPAMGGDPLKTTISGFSAGGQMSHLMHVIYSDFFVGVGIAAGGPYGCTGTNGYTVE